MVCCTCIGGEFVILLCGFQSCVWKVLSNNCHVVAAWKIALVWVNVLAFLSMQMKCYVSMCCVGIHVLSVKGCGWYLCFCANSRRILATADYLRTFCHRLCECVSERVLFNILLVKVCIIT